jgi:NAD(P)-dependent dehydrogenase (short-subunit alcohol dehydrogenase family)
MKGYKGIEGKVIFITGGNAGIGKATALAFAEEGAKVAIAARRQKEGDETVEEIRKNGGEAIFIKMDVREQDQVEAAINKTVETYGALNFAFNNAGILNPLGPIEELSREVWDDSIATNLTGVWLCMKYEIPHMLKIGGGVIVNHSSIHGLISNANGVSPYDASKHGVIGITKSAAMENAKRGIRVNVIATGDVRTPMMATLGEKFAEMIRARHPIGRSGTMEEVVQAVLFLCSDGAGFMTGSTVVIDGGLTAT